MTTETTSVAVVNATKRDAEASLTNGFSQRSSSQPKDLRLPEPASGVVVPLSSFPPASAFETVEVLTAVRIRARRVSELRGSLKDILLDRPGTKVVRLPPDDDDDNNNNSDNSPNGNGPCRILLLAGPDAYQHKALRPYLDDGSCVPTSYPLARTYDDWTVEEVLRAVLPSSIREIPTSYEAVGPTLAHINLKDEVLPYRRIVGKVLLDKNPSIKTVVNKLGSVGGGEGRTTDDDVNADHHAKFRTFPMEVIAGDSTDGWSEVVLKEEGCTFHLDYRKVYWNSRLAGEHKRLTKLLVGLAKNHAKMEGHADKKKLVVADFMAGIGPFAIPLAKSGLVEVHANDLNPSSYRYLVKNGHKNRLFTVTDTSTANTNTDEDVNDSLTPLPQSAALTCYNMDARSFCHHLQDVVGVDFDHAILNLPASAPEFLNAFRGYACRQKEGTQSSSFSAPRLHVHCFGPKDLTVATSALLQRCATALGCTLDKSRDRVEIHDVRNVAPNKHMYCVSFDLPLQKVQEMPRIDVANTDTAIVSTASTQFSSIEPEPKRVKVDHEMEK